MSIHGIANIYVVKGTVNHQRNRRALEARFDLCWMNDVLMNICLWYAVPKTKWITDLLSGRSENPTVA